MNYSSVADKQHEAQSAYPSISVILSIRPQYSAKIMDGSKTVELRRRFPVYISNNALAYIYSTSPICALIGSVQIMQAVKLPISVMWKQYSNHACITRSAFDEYFSGLDQGVALEVGSVRPLPRFMDLSELRTRFGFRPPQSFQYVKQELQTALQNEYSEISY